MLAARLAAVVEDIVYRHCPDFTNGTMQQLTCRYCTRLSGRPIAWPCEDRQIVGHLLPDPSNRLLPFGPFDSQPHPPGAGTASPDGSPPGVDAQAAP